MSFKKMLCLLCLVGSFSSFALEVDETLTLRILKVSSTKKTILINRGIEDGLTEGDHANFFLPEGVIARGVIIQLAPTRSAWAIYRIVNGDYLKEEEVMNLKITKPARLSSDPTRQVWKGNRGVRVETPSSKSQIALAPGAREQSLDEQEVGFSSSEESNPEFRELLGGKEKISTYSYEVFGGLYFANMGSKTSSDNNSGEVSGSQQNILLQLGGELYFMNPEKWYSNFSFAPFVQFSGQKVFGQRGSQTGNNFVDLGIMLNYYPLKNKPWHTGKLIPFLSFNYAMRNASDSFEPGAEVTTTLGGTPGNPQSFSGSGTGSVMSLGGGVKLYTAGGRWGIRFLLGYETTSITYGKDDSGVTWSRTGSGFKIMSGLGYRF